MMNRLLFQTGIDSLWFGSTEEEDIPPEELIRAVSLDETQHFPECDYDKSRSNLFKSIEARKWDLVQHFLLSGSWRGEFQPNKQGVAAQVCMWVTKYETSLDGKHERGRWTQLPIHAALIFGAPDEVIRLLVKICPGSLRCADEQRMLPLHLAFRHGASDETVGRMLDVFPEAIGIRDFEGHTPVESALNGPYFKRSEIIQTILKRQKEVWQKKEEKLLFKQRKQHEKITQANRSLESKAQEIADLTVAKDLIKWREEKAQEVLLTLVSEVKHINWWCKQKEKAAPRSDVIEDLSTKLAALQQVAEDLMTETRLQAKANPTKKLVLFGNLSNQTWTEADGDNESTSGCSTVSRLSMYAKNVHMNHHIVFLGSPDVHSSGEACKGAFARSSSNQQSSSHGSAWKESCGSKQGSVVNFMRVLKENESSLARNRSYNSNQGEASSSTSIGLNSRVSSHLKVDPTLTNSFMSESQESQDNLPCDPRTVTDREVEVVVALPKGSNQTPKYHHDGKSMHSSNKVHDVSSPQSEALAVTLLPNLLQLPNEKLLSQKCDVPTNVTWFQSSLLGSPRLSDKSSQRDGVGDADPIQTNFNMVAAPRLLNLLDLDMIRTPDQSIEQHLSYDSGALMGSVAPVACESQVAFVSNLEHSSNGGKAKSKLISSFKSFRSVTRNTQQLFDPKKLLKKALPKDNRNGETLTSGRNVAQEEEKRDTGSAARENLTKPWKMRPMSSKTEFIYSRPKLSYYLPLADPAKLLSRRYKNFSREEIVESMESVNQISGGIQSLQSNSISGDLLKGEMTNFGVQVVTGAADVGSSITVDKGVFEGKLTHSGWEDSNEIIRVPSVTASCASEFASSFALPCSRNFPSGDGKGLVIGSTDNFKQDNGFLNPEGDSLFAVASEEMGEQGSTRADNACRSRAYFQGSNNQGIETCLEASVKPKQKLSASFHWSNNCSQTSSSIFLLESYNQDRDSKGILANATVLGAPLGDDSDHTIAAVPCRGNHRPDNILLGEPGYKVPVVIFAESLLNESHADVEPSMKGVVSGKCMLHESICKLTDEVATGKNSSHAFDYNLGDGSSYIKRMHKAPNKDSKCFSRSTWEQVRDGVDKVMDHGRDISETLAKPLVSNTVSGTWSKFPNGVEWAIVQNCDDGDALESPASLLQTVGLQFLGAPSSKQQVGKEVSLVEFTDSTAYISGGMTVELAMSQDGDEGDKEYDEEVIESSATANEATKEGENPHLGVFEWLQGAFESSCLKIPSKIAHKTVSQSLLAKANKPPHCVASLSLSAKANLKSEGPSARATFFTSLVNLGQKRVLPM